MPEIRICSLKQVDQHRNWATHVTSLIDGVEFAPQFDAATVQHVAVFHDVEL